MRKLLNADKIVYFVLDIALIIGIGICVYVAISTYFDHQKYLHNYSGSISIGNTVEGFLAINFTSDVFSTYNPINVSASFLFSDDFKASHPFLQDRKTVQLIIFDSRPLKPQYLPNGEMIRPAMNLTKQVDGRYTGMTTMIFDSEGDKCYDFSSGAILIDNNCTPAITNTVIRISSVDSLLQSNTNRINLTLTWVLVAFTIVAVRTFLKDMIQNLLELMIKEVKKIEDKPTKPHPK